MEREKFRYAKIRQLLSWTEYRTINCKLHNLLKSISNSFADFLRISVFNYNSNLKKGISI